VIKIATLYEYYNTGEVAYTVFYGNNWKSQTFTPAVAHTITSVKLRLYREAGHLPGIITVSIRATDGNGKPTGGDLCSGTTNGNTLPEALPAEWREFDFGAGYKLDSGTKYAIVLRALNGDAFNRARLRYDTSGEYAGGVLLYSSNAGAGWLPEGAGGADAMFEDWGEPLAVPRSQSHIIG